MQEISAIHSVTGDLANLQGVDVKSVATPVVLDVRWSGRMKRLSTVLRPQVCLHPPYDSRTMQLGT